MTERYHAFVSYSRADEEIATDVQKALGTLMRRPLRRSYLKIFRDRTSLTPGSDLGQLLRNALDSSDWLIVLLSRASAASPWVSEEIRHWMQRGDDATESILLLRCDDSVDLGWTDQGSLRAPGSLPAALAAALRTEPLYIDVVDRGPGWADAAAVLLAAAMLGREPADIASEDLRQHRRARRLATVGCALLAVLALVAVAAGVVARSNAARADSNAAKAEQNAATAKANEDRAVTFALTSQAEQWVDTRPGDALGLALLALDRGSSTEAMSLIHRTLNGLPPDMWFAHVDPGSTDVEVSPAGDVVAILSTPLPDPATVATEPPSSVQTTVRFFDLNTFEPIAQSATFETAPSPTMRFLGDGSLLVLGRPTSYHIEVADDRASVTELDTSGLPESWLDVRLVEGTGQLRMLWTAQGEGDPPGFSSVHLDQLVVAGDELQLVSGVVTEPLEGVEFGAISMHGFHFVVGRGFKLALSDPWARVFQVPDDATGPVTEWVDIAPGLRPVSAAALDGFCYAGAGLPDKPCGTVDVVLNGEAYELGDRTGRQERVFIRGTEVVTDQVISDPQFIRNGFVCHGLGYVTDAGLTIVSDVGVDAYPAPTTIDASTGSSFEAFDVACGPDGRWVMVSSSGQVRIGRGGRSTISGTATALRVAFDGEGVSDGSIGTPDNITIRRGAGGTLELVADGSVIATAGFPGAAAVIPGEKLVPQATTTAFDVTEGLTWENLEYFQVPTFPGAGGDLTINDLTDPASPRRVFNEVLFGDQVERAMFMSKGVLLGYIGSVNGEFLIPTLFLFGDAEILRLACGVGARVPDEIATQLGVPAGVPATCTSP